jgi:hypothetical protein
MLRADQTVELEPLEHDRSALRLHVARRTVVPRRRILARKLAKQTLGFRRHRSFSLRQPNPTSLANAKKKSQALSATEGFLLKVMNDLRTRSLGDILIAVVDGLKGFPEAIGQCSRPRPRPASST